MDVKMEMSFLKANVYMVFTLYLNSVLTSEILEPCAASSGYYWTAQC